MFSFHRPRVYRSAAGCCICRAKSSSSRFTDSGKYEEDFEDCFKLKEDRTGEICNACVLLVKRWKKLPKGSQRNWHHVVDARAGHGSKPISKINKVKKNMKAKLEKVAVEFKQIPMKKDLYIPQGSRTRESSPSCLSDDVQMECMSSESGSYYSSLAPSPAPSAGDLNDENELLPTSQEMSLESCRKKLGKGRVKRRNPRKIKSKSSISSFLDLNFWKREKTCCGIIFKGPCGELMVDKRYLNPCNCSNSNLLPSPQFESIPSISTEAANSPECFSVDSGYEDENSNLANNKTHRHLPSHHFSTLNPGPKQLNNVYGSYMPAYNII